MVREKIEAMLGDPIDQEARDQAVWDEQEARDKQRQIGEKTSFRLILIANLTACATVRGGLAGCYA